MSLDIQKTTAGKLLISRKETAKRYDIGRRRSEIIRQRSVDVADAVREIQDFLAKEKLFEPKFKIIQKGRE